MDQNRADRAVFFMTAEETSSGALERPLMLESILFCPMLAWARDSLVDAGVQRFFVFCQEEFASEIRACFAPEDDVVISDDRAETERFLEGEGRVLVFPDAEIPMMLEGRGYAYTAEASALIEGWFRNPSSNAVAGWQPERGWSSIRGLAELQAQELAVRDAIVEYHMSNGVRFLDPAAVYIDPRAEIGRGTVVLPGTILRGRTVIGRDCEIGPNTMIRDCTVGDRTVVNASQCNESVIGNDTNVGPFAYIRPNCTVGDHIKVGDFVELKNSVIGNGTKISHLTYVGDSDVGQRVNFGCGTITTNYDGFQKHRCTIGDDVFLGCNTNLVAPVTVGDRAYTAAGSTVTKEVPADALHIARPPEVLKEGWAARWRHRHGKD